MTNFHFSKIIATVGPSLAKETILSKVINLVDVFRIDLSLWFDEMRKKYIDTILKLDNSKTIMMQIKGWEFKSKNHKAKTYKKWQQVHIDYSEFVEESDWDTLFTDYHNLSLISTGTEISFEDSTTIFIVNEVNDTRLSCVIKTAWTVHPHKNIHFLNFETNDTYLTPRDKKDISRWMQAGVSIIIAPNVTLADEVNEVNYYIKNNGTKQLKVFAYIQNKEALSQFEEICQSAHGIIFADELFQWLKPKEQLNFITTCKVLAKPLIIGTHFFNGKKKNNAFIESFSEHWIDWFMLTDETSIDEDPLAAISGLYDCIHQRPSQTINAISFPDMSISNENENQILDYIIFNAHRITQEMDIKAIVCFTSTGLTTAKISSSKPLIPVISFTKSDETYRYINMMWWVKWYKISHTFNYENLKKIGKEMIRIIFKWNISLDDKILIVLAHEDENEVSNMMNGIEIYKFKNI